MRPMICYKRVRHGHNRDGERACSKCRRKPPPNRRKRLGVNPSAQTRTMTIIDYKGFRIEVCAVGKGWRASIFSPGSTSQCPNSLAIFEKMATKKFLAKPKGITAFALGHGRY